VVIPKSANSRRISENLAALDISLSSEDLAELDNAFAAPASAVRLQMR